MRHAAAEGVTLSGVFTMRTANRQNFGEAHNQTSQTNPLNSDNVWCLPPYQTCKVAIYKCFSVGRAEKRLAKPDGFGSSGYLGAEGAKREMRESLRQKDKVIFPLIKGYVLFFAGLRFASPANFILRSVMQ